ncbi:MAG: hypothetical protein AAGK23_08870 [Pseudomonadota bacterium]
MKMSIVAALAAGFIVAGCTATGGSVSANSLIQSNDTGLSLADMAQQVDEGATKAASDPACQTIRTNYYAALEDIGQGSTATGLPLGQLSSLNANTSGTAGSLARLGNNVGVNTTGAARGISNSLGAVNEAANIANDLAAVGSLFGLGGKSPEEKVADLDREALEAARMTGCPTATFG